MSKLRRVLSKIRAHSLQHYRGKCLATFGQMVFDQLRKPSDRPGPCWTLLHSFGPLWVLSKSSLHSSKEKKLWACPPARSTCSHAFPHKKANSKPRIRSCVYLYRAHIYIFIYLEPWGPTYKALPIYGSTSLQTLRLAHAASSGRVYLLLIDVRPYI